MRNVWVCVIYLDGELLSHTQAFRHSDSEDFLPAELQRVGVLTRQKL